jgi:hypothetical protein
MRAIGKDSDRIYLRCDALHRRMQRPGSGRNGLLRPGPVRPFRNNQGRECGPMQLLREPAMRMQSERTNRHGNRQAQPTATQPRHQAAMRYQRHPMRIALRSRSCLSKEVLPSLLVAGGLGERAPFFDLPFYKDVLRSVMIRNDAQDRCSLNFRELRAKHGLPNSQVDGNAILDGHKQVGGIFNHRNNQDRDPAAAPAVYSRKRHPKGSRGRGRLEFARPRKGFARLQSAKPVAQPIRVYHWQRADCRFPATQVGAGAGLSPDQRVVGVSRQSHRRPVRL